MSYYVGSDIGGTFTDCVVIDERGQVAAGKAPTTPHDFSQGVLMALAEAASKLGVSVGDLLREVAFFPHGCTVATNALITRNGARVGMLTTKGFEQTLFMMRGSAYCQGLPVERWYQKSRNDRPFDLVPLELIAGVTERVDKEGREVVPLSEREVLHAAEALVEGEGIEALAIGFLWSFMNPSHEIEARALVKRRYPGLCVDISSEVAAAIGEYERFSTLAINSYLRPAVEDYVGSLEEKMRAQGLEAALLVMQASGGLRHARDAAPLAVGMLHSGPVGGLVAARMLGDLLGLRRLITGDMGGTSFDTSIIVDGELRYTRRSYHERHAVSLPMADITSIGAGGGSIAYVDEGVLKVGPRSAGMMPGPACYGRGGEEPTVTDANLVLGYLNPEYFLGGRMRLEPARARQAIEQRVAGPLGVGVEEAAAGIVSIVNAHMADAIRFFVLQRGYDPRDFDLLIFGGAGPAHGAEIGRELEVRSVLVPLCGMATVLSAFGIANSDFVRLYQTSRSLPFPPADLGELEELYREMEARALADFASDGFPAHRVSCTRSASMRYHLQLTDIDVVLPPGRLDRRVAEEICSRFDRQYAELYGESAGFKEAGRDMISQDLRAVVEMPKGRIEAWARGASTPGRALKGERVAYFGGEPLRATVFAGELMEPGDVLEGPALIESEGTTVVIPPGCRAVLDPYTNIRLEWR